MNVFRRIMPSLLVLLIVLARQMTVCGQPVAQPNTSTLTEWCTAHLDEFDSLYRQFHRHPELSFQEAKTDAPFASELTKRGVENVTSNFGGHSVVGVIENGDGPTLLLRADLDGMPITNKRNLVCASKEHLLKKS